MIIDSQCKHCSHFNSKNLTKNSCKAFFDGIPLEIFLNEFIHDRPYKGDNNIQFRQKVEIR